jgi:hypothetical protein
LLQSPRQSFPALAGLLSAPPKSLKLVWVWIVPFTGWMDWMQVLQLIGVREVDYSITRRTKKIGLGRVLHGKRLLDLCHRAAMAGTPPAVPAARDPQPEPVEVDHESPPVSGSHAPRAGKRG